jgi:diguanylate cyclase (GGDEF)-like protein
VYTRINKEGGHSVGRFVQRWGILLIAGVLLCGAWSYLTVSFGEQRQRLLDERQRELAQLNSAVAFQSAGLLKLAETHLRTLDRFLQANPRTNPRTDPHFVALADMLRKSSNGLIELRMVSVDGKLFYIPPPEGKSSGDVSDKAYFRAQLAGSGQKLYLGDPVLSRVTGKWGVPISWRLEAPVSGMLVMFAGIELDHLFGVYEKLRVKPAGTITLINDKGIVLSRMPPDPSVIGKSVSGTPGFTSEYGAKARGAFISDGALSEGVRRVVSFERLAEYPVIVLVSEDVHEVLAPYYERRNLTLTISAGVTVALLLVAFFLQRFLRTLNAVQKDLEIAARIDSLTGTLSRRSFLDIGAREFSRAHRYERPTVVLALDIDHFKKVNDTYGHAKGDAVLRECCAAWLTVLREQDFLGRLGGEEFSAILPETGLDGAWRVADRLRQVTAKLRFASEYAEFGVTVSIGMATITAADQQLSHVMERADKALYVAKKQGRNRVETVEPPAVLAVPDMAAG